MPQKNDFLKIVILKLSQSDLTYSIYVNENRCPHYFSLILYEHHLISSISLRFLRASYKPRVNIYWNYHLWIKEWMQLSAQGVVHLTTNFTYIVAHALYTYARKPVESESIYFVLRLG